MLKDMVAGGDHFRLETRRGPIHVWKPTGGASEGVTVYVHGYFDTVDSAWTKHRLAEQFAASGRREVFIVPGAPSARGEPVSWPDLLALLTEVERQTGLVLTRRVTAIGHSAGFETIAKWLPSLLLDEVVLLDALYGFVPAFRDWAKAPGHRLVLVVTRSGTPRQLSESLIGQLEKLGLQPVKTSGDPSTLDGRARAAKVLYIVSADDHFGLVTSGRLIPVLLRRSGIGLGTVFVAGVAGIVLWKLIA